MLSGRLLKYLVTAILLSAAFNWYMGLSKESVGVLEFFLSVAIGTALHWFVIVKLPVFRRYYDRDLFSMDRTHRSYPNMKAAAALSSLIAGGVAAGIFELASGGERTAAFAFCAAIAAGVMSFYRDNA